MYKKLDVKYFFSYYFI